MLHRASHVVWLSRGAGGWQRGFGGRVAGGARVVLLAPGDCRMTTRRRAVKAAWVMRELVVASPLRHGLAGWFTA
ncbi:hypothetical protein Ga0074812_10611 [Parafrankia irregularis]|uniref:Uncharacterized protein n=1 Tax=Parafrankia irregularis TaxID=795642 RepID=A0A0S4QJM1_9ACTN|nr:hypothetical protein Ga0074812_10611 [Parafrankia irregularis]